ncbi:angiopoietin-related protein 7-like [Saccostrea echinata]|uniref:angiopoietin-related protein 7-like n=1 Tax=Saccostrea echinata TaxID=191078 RepID=UPI002A7EAAEB|nr:angiopoietin-related protein 7-like [Saccostrea echinata]
MEKSQLFTLIFFFIRGTFGYLELPANDPSEENNLFRSTTSGKTSNILRDILNQESLVRFSMVQKIQNLVMDAIDNKNNTEILKKKLFHLAKELKALETKDQILEQDNVELRKELSGIYNRISDNQNLTITNIHTLNETEIYFLKRQFLALRRENEELKLVNSKMKEQLKVDEITFRNETFAMKEQYSALSQENDAIESKLHQMEKEIRSTNIDSRLKMIEGRVWNLSISVDEALDDIREEQNVSNTQLLVSSLFQSDCSVPFDCYDIYNCGIKKTGIYKIFPYRNVNNSTSVQVLCDMELTGGGWTVIQHRNRDNPRVNFNTTWDEYKRGFGDVNGNYWLGNDVIHKLTTTFQNELYIKMKSTNNQDHEVKYNQFSISSEADGYRLSLGTKIGSITDAFRGYNIVNEKFSTFDHDNQHRCGSRCGSGWWFKYCTWTNLNAPFFEDHLSNVWYPSIDKGKNLYQSKMMIKRK